MVTVSKKKKKKTQNLVLGLAERKLHSVREEKKKKKKQNAKISKLRKEWYNSLD